MLNARQRQSVAPDEKGNPCITLGRRAQELRDQLSKVDDIAGATRTTRGSSMTGRKVAVKYRDKAGYTWAGRGAQLVWLREKLKGGAKLEDFAVEKQPAVRKKTVRRKKARRGKK